MIKLPALAPALLLSLSLCAQKPAAKPKPYAQTDALALQLPDSLSGTVDKIAGYVNAHFTTPTEKTRAIFMWIADKIEYDVVNMFALNFYDDPAEDIARPLRTRKGICVNYASLFTALCNKVGVQSVVVQGYTKQRGFVGYIPHAWSAAVVDGSWYLFDPGQTGCGDPADARQRGSSPVRCEIAGFGHRADARRHADTAAFAAAQGGDGSGRAAFQGGAGMADEISEQGEAGQKDHVL